MKTKFFTVFAALLMVFAYSSCTSGSKSKKTGYASPEMEFRNSLTAEDTVNMLKLADDCMELLQKKDIDGAISMLNAYDDSTKEVTPLTDDVKKRLRHLFTVFPVLKYEREYFSFMLEGLNDVRYKIWFAEEKDPAKNGEPVTRLMFNPVLVDGEWYLCIKNQGQGYDVLHQ